MSGPLLQYIQEAPLIKYDVMRTELIQFQAGITNAGVITQPPQVTLPTDFHFINTGLMGYVQDPVTDSDDIANVTFQIWSNTERRFLFNQPINMALLCRTNGPVDPIVWRGIHPFTPGDLLTCTFAIPAGYATTNNKVMGVVLIGDLIAPRKTC